MIPLNMYIEGGSLLVSQPDDLRFGVALCPACEVHSVPRGYVNILRLRCDPGNFCSTVETHSDETKYKCAAKDEV